MTTGNVISFPAISRQDFLGRPANREGLKIYLKKAAEAIILQRLGNFIRILFNLENHTIQFTLANITAHLSFHRFKIVRIAAICRFNQLFGCIC